MPLAFVDNIPVLGSMADKSFVQMARYGRSLSERESLINAQRAPRLAT